MTILQIIEENICVLINNLFPKRQLPGRESPISYSWAEYIRARFVMNLHAPYMNLENKICADIGCGLGGKTVFYSENGCKFIVGLDFDKYRVKYSNEFARKKQAVNTNFLVGSIGALPFKSHKLEIIFLNDMVEHIRREILIDALQECKRVIGENGRIFIEFCPWTAYYAAHLYDYINIPWCQFVFSSETLIKVVKRKNPKAMFGELSYIEHFQQLNHITIGEFQALITKLDFEVLNYSCRFIKNVRYFKYFPFINNFLVTHVVAVLSKKSAKDEVNLPIRGHLNSDNNLRTTDNKQREKARGMKQLP